MKKIIVLFTFVMTLVMIMMMLAACAQDNTSDNGSINSGSTSTGVVGRWKDTDNLVYEFTSGNIYMDGSVYGRYYGNDAEGELSVNDIWFYYTVSSNSMTWTMKNDSSVKEYLTRM